MKKNKVKIGYILKVFNLKNNDIKNKKINILKNLDSIDLLYAIVKLEKKYKKKIPLSKILKMKNLNKLIDYLIKWNLKSLISK